MPQEVIRGVVTGYPDDPEEFEAWFEEYERRAEENDRDYPPFPWAEREAQSAAQEEREPDPLPPPRVEAEIPAEPRRVAATALPKGQMKMDVG